MKVISFHCDNCSNTNPNKTKVYEGMMGYESITCLCCGTFYDHSGVHPYEENSVYMKKVVDSFNRSMVIF
jgi:hypothetical protein